MKDVRAGWVIGKVDGMLRNCRVAPNPQLAACNNSSHFYNYLFLNIFISRCGREGFCCSAGSLRQTDNSTTILFALHQVGVSPESHTDGRESAWKNTIAVPIFYLTAPEGIIVNPLELSKAVGALTDEDLR
ncbi:MAG: hypothetical protein HOQ33_22805, partial [Cupriavidus sp.]|nr:hypothetical protein [Cupriavidus sp.]